MEWIGPVLVVLMADMSHTDKIVAMELFNMFPPSIQESLAESPTFRCQFDLDVGATLGFGDSGVSVKRSDFYTAVRELYRLGPEASVEATLLDGQDCGISFQDSNGELVVCVECSGRTVMLPSFWFFATERAQRMAALEAELSRRNIQVEAIQPWRDLLWEGPLSDEKADRFQKVLRLAPSQIAEALSIELQKDESDVSVLVPRSIEYYERLVGACGSSISFDAFLESQATTHIRRLLEWDSKQGLAQSLLFSAHPSFAPLIDISDWDVMDVVEFFEWLEASGDRFSQVAGFEVAVAFVDRFPEVEPQLLRIAKAILDDDVSASHGRLAFSSNLFVFVDGELSRTGLFRDRPPFWRRMAATAQAAMIEREMLHLGVDLQANLDWARQGRGRFFFMQTLADLRTEPRWLPDLMNSEQLRQEFIFRMVIAGDRAKERLPSGELQALLLEDEAGSLRSSMAPPFAYLPGPLEGASVAPQPFPPEMLEELRKPIDKGVVDANFFASAVNYALVLRLDNEVSSLIADVLRSANHRLNFSGESEITFSLLAGLSVVAAVTRSPELMNEIRVLTRVLRRRKDTEIEPDNEMRIGLIACAAHKDLDRWCASVGDWFLEIANEEIEIDMAAGLREHLRHICQITPQLWRSCAGAEAALSAVIGRAA